MSGPESDQEELADQERLTRALESLQAGAQPNGRPTSLVASLVSWVGAAVLTAGVYFWFGRGPALVVTGLLVVLFANGWQQSYERRRRAGGP